MDRKGFRSIASVMGMALTLCTAPALVNTEDLSAADLQNMNAVHAEDRLTITPSGEACYMQGDERKTGKFYLEPNFILGDVNNDMQVDAADAAEVLTASAELGGGASVDEAFLIYADANEDGTMDASDATEILIYAARKGVDQNILPLGAAYFYADENGVLQTGRIDDAATGESYYAGEDYKLLTGWAYVDGHAYYLNAEGVMQKNTWMQTESGTTCWLGADGALTVNSWADTPEGRCWLGVDGTPVDGLYVIANKGYYFENNLMQTGWLTIGEKTCYAGEDGALYRGIKTVDGNTYYFASGYEMARGWVKQTAGSYYFNENGIMLTGWQEIDGNTYYLAEDGIRQTGFTTVEDYTYYLGTDGILQTGFLNIDGADYYFYPETGHMATGFVYMNYEDVYYFGEDGRMATGWQTLGEDSYYFDENGIMATGFAVVDGVAYQFADDGVCQGEFAGDISDINVLLNLTAAGAEQKRSITVYDQQKGTGKELVDFTFTLKDSDIAIIEQFLAENTPANATVAEKLYLTHQWIHYNVDYAYAGEKWNEIVNLSYVDAIFNHRKGQCVQYNGAMALVLAYYGFDVYMVKGYTSPGVQHFWTEVEMNGHTYMVECGNSGKNGDWWQYFFDQMN